MIINGEVLPTVIHNDKPYIVLRQFFKETLGIDVKSQMLKIKESYEDYGIILLPVKTGMWDKRYMMSVIPSSKLGLLLHRINPNKLPKKLFKGEIIRDRIIRLQKLFPIA